MERAQAVEALVTRQLSDKGILKHRDLYLHHQFPNSYNELIAPFFISDDELKIAPGLDRDMAMVPSERPIRPLPKELVQNSLRYTPSKIDPIALQAQKRAQMEAQQLKAKPKPKRRKKERGTIITDADRYGYTPASFAGDNGYQGFDEFEVGHARPEEEVESSQEIVAAAPTVQYDQDAVIQTLFNHFRKHSALKTPDARWPFFARIDRENAASFQIPDYFDKINEHVNLIDIGERIATGYSSLDDFTDDMRRMFTNVLTYFDPSSVQYQTSVTLKNEFETMLQQAIGSDYRH